MNLLQDAAGKLIASGKTVFARALSDAAESHLEDLSSLLDTAGVAASEEAVAGWGQQLEEAADKAEHLVEDTRQWVRTLANQGERYREFVRRNPSDSESAKFQERLDSIADAERTSRAALATVESDILAMGKSVSSCRDVLDKIRKKGEEARAAKGNKFVFVCCKTVAEISLELLKLKIKANDASLLTCMETLAQLKKQIKEAEGERIARAKATTDSAAKTEEADKEAEASISTAPPPTEAAAAATATASSSVAWETGERAESEEKPEEEDEDSMIRRVAMEAIRAKMKELNWLD